MNKQACRKCGEVISNNLNEPLSFCTNCGASKNFAVDEKSLSLNNQMQSNLFLRFYDSAVQTAGAAMLQHNVRVYKMKKMRKFSIILIIIFELVSLGCIAFPQKSESYPPQKSESYPVNADGIISFVEVFSRADFSLNDAVKRFGTINAANRDDAFSGTDWHILLTPFPPERERIKRVVLLTYDNKTKLDAVDIDFVKPILISYGKLKEKYGAPSPLRLPHVTCLEGVDCQPAFAGYEFSFVPDHKNPASEKRREVFISLEMKWSKIIPKHSDKDVVEVKSILFKRI